MDLFEIIFRRKELRRLRAGNEGLVEHNKKIENQLRIKALQCKDLELEIKYLRKKRGRNV